MMACDVSPVAMFSACITIFDQFKGLADLQVGEELHADEAWKSGVVR